MKRYLFLLPICIALQGCPKPPDRGDQHAVDPAMTKGTTVSPNPAPGGPDVVTGTDKTDGTGHATGRDGKGGSPGQ